MLPITDIRLNDKPVSRLALGTHQFGKENADRCFTILDRFAEGGGTVLDSGRAYHAGESEAVIGQWLRHSGMQDRMVVITKGGNARIPDGVHLDDPGSRVHAACIEEDIRISLETLGTDSIDLYFVHKDNPDTPVAEIIEVLNKYVHSGVLRHIGASNWTTARIAEANAYAAAHGLRPFECSELAFSLKRNSTEDWGRQEGALEMSRTDFAWYEKNRMPVLGYNPQAYGFFYRPDGEKGASPENAEILRRFRCICAEKGLNAQQALFGFYAGCGLREIPIVSTLNPDHLREILENADKTLDPASVRSLLEVRFRGE